MIDGILFALLVLSSVVLIGVVLIQRGRGGGLAGAFGGTGGATAFGTKSGDVFTKITIYVAIVWIGLNMLLVYRLNHGQVSALAADPNAPKASTTTLPGSDPGKTTGDGATTDALPGISPVLPPVGEPKPTDAPSK